MSYTARGGVSWRHTTQRDTQREVEALFDDCCDTARVQRGLACEEAVGETRRCKATRRDVRALYGIIYTPECEKQVTDDSTDSHSAQTPGTFHDFQTCHRGARLCLVRAECSFHHSVSFGRTVPLSTWYHRPSIMATCS